MYITFEVTQNSENNILCRAVFKAGDGGIGGTYLELTGDDEIFCNNIPLQKFELAGIVEYKANVGESSSNNYDFQFNREGESYTSHATIPPRPIISSPEQGVQLQKTEIVSILWDYHPGTNVDITLSYAQDYHNENGSHHKSGGIHRYQTPETGSQNISPTFEFAAGDAYGEVQIKRYQTGSHDPSLNGRTEGSSITKTSFTFIDL